MNQTQSTICEHAARVDVSRVLGLGRSLLPGRHLLTQCMDCGMWLVSRDRTEHESPRDPAGMSAGIYPEK